MKVNLKKFFAAMLSSAMVFSSFAVPAMAEESGLAEGSVELMSALTVKGGGAQEDCFVEWLNVSGADHYKVYVKKTSESSWTEIDDELIRQYAGYLRADAVGLAAGTYDMKVVGYDSSGSEIASGTAEGLEATSYDRSGAAFSTDSTFYDNGALGAYNADGTLKDDAVVIYVTPETAKTVTETLITSSKGATTEYTGFQDIVYGLQKGYETRPIDIRVVGMITADDMDYFGSSSEGLQIKGKDKYSDLNLTIEGIGEDSGFNGFGMLLRNAGNAEIRNLGLFNFMDDGVSIDSDNCNLWIHNLDIFYGSAGSDDDQAKGDGSVDLKDISTYCTVSYNHFFDSGKCSLGGMKSETTSVFNTYHHNWFDHSDSRHPRIRTMSVHVYNNYYDGNSKYGVGMTMGGSAFVENNYFRSCKYPVMISLQGSDAQGDGTFSGENGGIIKMYNNIMAGTYKYIEGKNGDTYSNDADGYTVDKREETLPSSLTCLTGGTSYNNFDTEWDLGVDEADITAVEDVPAVVMANAGRLNGGDFSWTFTEDEDTSYAINSDLKSAVTNYETSIVKFGGDVSGSTFDVSSSSTSVTGIDGNTSYTDKFESYAETAEALPTETDESGNKTSGGSGSSTSAVKYQLLGSSVTAGTYSDNVTGLGTDGMFSILATSDKTVTVSSSKGIQLGGAGSTTYRCITFTTGEETEIAINSASTSSDTRTLNIENSKGEVVASINTGDSSICETALPADTYYVYSTYKGINVTSIYLYSTADEDDEGFVDDGEDGDEDDEDESSSEEASSESTTATETSTETTTSTTTTATQTSTETTTSTTTTATQTTTKTQTTTEATTEGTTAAVDDYVVVDISGSTSTAGSISSYTGTDTAAVVPEEVTAADGSAMTITSIGENAFASSVAEVVIPATVTQIADNAFGNSDVVIFTDICGSYVQSYADENNIECVILGDATNDGRLSATDAAAALKYAKSGYSLTDLGIKAVSYAVNSGAVDSSAAAQILKKIRNKDYKFQ